ncbi:hypothetical protein [Phosphitispora fastidiosa]|uniref:hypothetical protein n=1 Tax=Phosphitispora fastidiosa TaxID=2837202 RepID=UPI001E35E8A6|nr:hypothetical protein [Phosphitispora fastidiosa]MBU7005323.1 hypothetical protein [Phosphitispora fastidiosa]
MHISSLVNSAYFKPLVLTKDRESKSAVDRTPPMNALNISTGDTRDFAVILELTSRKNSSNSERLK